MLFYQIQEEILVQLLNAWALESRTQHESKT